ncbi:hypothetical protein BKG63_21850 [Mycobacteroides chelonae]|nr:hypothetical protein BKG63_21850 [Mycobacteroides chelonae]
MFITGLVSFFGGVRNRTDRIVILELRRAISHGVDGTEGAPQAGGNFTCRYRPIAGQCDVLGGP